MQISTRNKEDISSPKVLDCGLNSSGGMSRLIPMMDEIHNALISSSPAQELSHQEAQRHAALLVDLPQVVVVGAQSVGKSSVLEAIVGRDFLPRGTGVVTRRPLHLHLRHTDKQHEEWGEFGHLPGQKFASLVGIRDEIQNETNRLLGTSKVIGDVPISLYIHSSEIIDLTLIDLPGVTKVPMDGQPADIEDLTRSLVFSYIERPSCIILAVTPGNADIANSDSLNLARAVDPLGVRTIGVLTKIDLMDEGTDAMDILSGKVYPLKRGHVGLVCRSQIGTEKRINIKDAIEDEEEFFSSHPVYKRIADKCGSRYLAKMLNKILMHHIRESLPGIKSRIRCLIEDYTRELSQYGEGPEDGNSSSTTGAMLLHFFFKFARNFEDAIDGKLSMFNNSSSTTELCGGARINYIFHNVFGRMMNEFAALQGLTDAEIQIAIRNATGPGASLFVPEEAFEMLVKKQIAKLELPALECVEHVYKELQLILERCLLPEMTYNYLSLRDSVLEVSRDVLRRSLKPTNSMISSLIKIELAYLNTNHPDFVGGCRLFPFSHEHLLERRHQKQTIVSEETADHRRSRASISQQQTSHDTELAQLACSSTVLNTRPATGLFSFLMGGGPTFPTVKSCFTDQKPHNNDTNNSRNHSLATSSSSQLNPCGGSAPPVLQHHRRASQALTCQNDNANDGIHNHKNALFGGAAKNAALHADVPLNREFVETELIKSLIVSYFNIVRKNIADLVPKSIMAFMVNRAKEVMQRELVSKLYKEDLYESLLKESDNVVERRQYCKKTLRRLNKASEILDSIRELQP